jgi:hypothetical protein
MLSTTARNALSGRRPATARLRADKLQRDLVSTLELVRALLEVPSELLDPLLDSAPDLRFRLGSLLVECVELRIQLADVNPRHHDAVLVAEELAAASARWACETGASPSRTPEALALALSTMLTNWRQLHLVDPHFGPENARHRKVLEALMGVLGESGLALDIVRVHCTEKLTLTFFE